MVEDKKPVKSEKMEIVDETDTVRHGYVRKARSSSWTSRGWHLSFLIYICKSSFSALTLLVGRQERHLACETWWTVEVALVSPDGVAPNWVVDVSASVNLPLHHKVQKFSSGTGSPGWSRKKGRKTVVVLWWWCKSSKGKEFPYLVQRDRGVDNIVIFRQTTLITSSLHNLYLCRLCSHNPGGRLLLHSMRPMVPFQQQGIATLWPGLDYIA